MKYWIVVLVVLYASVAVDGSKMTLAEPAPEPCKPTNEEDIASSDPLVNHMFEAYKVRLSILYSVTSLAICSASARGKIKKKFGKFLSGPPPYNFSFRMPMRICTV